MSWFGCNRIVETAWLRPLLYYVFLVIWTRTSCPDNILERNEHECPFPFSNEQYAVGPIGLYTGLGEAELKDTSAVSFVLILEIHRKRRSKLPPLNTIDNGNNIK